MKKLYLLLVMLCVAVASWAQDYTLTDATWYAGNPQEVQGKFGLEGNQKAVCVNVTAGHLSEAVEAINANANYNSYSILRITNNGAKVELNASDIAALKNLDFKTIDLQDVVYKEGGVEKAFTFKNAFVKNLILPDNWTKDEVKACAEQVGTRLGSAISQGTHDDENASVAAYVRQGGTLAEAVQHIFLDQLKNTKLGDGIDQNTHKMGKLYHLYVAGYPVAVDFCRNEGVFDENGHLVYDKEADESSTDEFAAVGGGTRTAQGTTKRGPWYDNPSWITVDIEDAIIEDQYNEDIAIFNKSYSLGNVLKVFKLPTYAGFNTIPADFIKGGCEKFRQICIPANIMYIKTRAFHLESLDHVWTTGTAENVVYDNGVYLYGDDEPKTGWLPMDKENIHYGTYTLPANLKLIESNAFQIDQAHVKDLYVLSVQAPDCHVDAFGPDFYHANNTIAGKVVDGIITRDAYANDTENGTYMTMLHYPRECTTPDIQRYTDVTREYSIATGERDGKGAIIYFPNMSEFTRAFIQGTNGYVWYAWEPTREDYTNAIKYVGNIGEGHTAKGQKDSNDFYVENANTSPAKTDRSFYDVTEGGTLAQPEGLKEYWTVNWEGKQLYPQPEENVAVYVSDPAGEYVYVNGQYVPYTAEYEGQARFTTGRTVFDLDENGAYIYKVDANGEYQKVRTYEADENGAYVQEVTAAENPENGEYVKDYSYAKADYADASTVYYYHDISYLEDSEGEYVKDYVWETVDWNDYFTQNEYGNPVFTGTDINDFQSMKPAEWGGGVYHYPVKTDDWYNKGQLTLQKRTLRYVKYTGQDGQRYTLADNGYKVCDDPANYDGQLYTKEYSKSYRKYEAATDAGETRYDVTFGDFRTYNESTDADLQRYSGEEAYQLKTALADNQSLVDENSYSIKTKRVEIPAISLKHDYRGWHQFVLTAYATNSTEEFTPIRSYITDNDWWTICLPFDLTKADMVKLFGKNGSFASADLPYLSKLTYVVRDMEKKKIVLTFSKNLLENKEVVEEGHNHGVIQEGTPVANDDIVLHKGVSYLIRPNLDLSAGSAVRQFDIKKSEYPELYQRIKDSEALGGKAQMDIIYKGIYTVPAYVVNDDGSETTYTEETVPFTMGDGTVFNHENKATTQISYKGEMVNAKISKKFDYSFVGTFYLSLLPQYSYFLGWDSQKNKAAFWFNRVPDLNDFNWNNETGVICPNWDMNWKISEATGLNDPARWILYDQTVSKIECDDIEMATGSAKNRLMEMQFGYEGSLSEGEATGIIDVMDASDNTRVRGGIYSIAGQYFGTDAEKLPKGIYVVNGKKFIVK